MQAISGSDNGLSPVRCQAIIWTNGGLLLIGTLATNFNVIWIKLQQFSHKKSNLKISSAEWPPFYLYLKMLMIGRGTLGPDRPNSWWDQMGYVSKEWKTWQRNYFSFKVFKNVYITAQEMSTNLHFSKHLCNAKMHWFLQFDNNKGVHIC